ncbi:hypothetical protein CspeluHIS016_0202300 [Cutaneotrichosporon spelunceum]|uniref:Carboxylic ester hydrolase n=1 Tax=Cutaneotrichosporon spelunceum TaxID=1672016 RepID=A0AAD3TR80_9TREE|nr:hypothetical protein CspeluHIS016_0202300 [Cutaneotrichosporon spelunceum]
MLLSTLLLGLLSGVAGQTATSSAFDALATRPSSVLGNATAFVDAKFHPPSGPVKVTGMLQDGLGIFLGIPFAQPPVGDLRFKKPVPASYEKHIMATERPPACLQQLGSVAANVSGISEDCLFVNVITPANAVGEGCKLKDLPVLVWIYGGGFYGGSAVLYTSPSLSSHALNSGKPIVLVTIGYRVGIFGFGHGREMRANGALNLGLRDQLLGLQWVKDNIAGFGGDPCKVTIFGESAGSMSVSAHMLNQTQDLFRGAIMQSGTVTSLGGFGDDTVYQEPYDKLVEFAGCNGTESSFLCLKALSGEDLLAAQVEMTSSKFAYTWGYPFGPAIDGDLIPASPYHMIENGTFSKIPFIAGCNSDEGTTFISASLSPNLTAWPLSTAMEIAYPFPLPQEFYDRIGGFYPRDGTGCPFNSGTDLFNGSVSAAWKQVTAVFTDLLMESRRRWLLRTANGHGLNQTWSYEFRGYSPPDPPYWGSSHEADKPYVFGRAVPELGYSPDQVALGKAMMDYWINFVYCLDPNGEGDSGLAHWPTHDFPTNKNSLEMDIGSLKVIQDDFREQSMAYINEPQNAFYIRKRDM